jgi:glycosyltransferase involved in cell wall biosynthesis
MRPDVIHVHHPFPISLAALTAGRVHRVPVVATNHTIPECTLFGLRGSLTYRPAMIALGLHIRMALTIAQAVTTPTETAARLLRDLGFRKPILAISNGVDTTRFRPDPLRVTAESVPIVLYTGRLDDDKDMDTFIRAIPYVLKRVQARFRIGGEGTDRARLERLVASMGLSEHVQFTGYVKDDDLPAVYDSAAVYAISSRVELQSISTLEAMASGLPIVAVNAGALPEIVRSGVNGFLVPPGDSEAFGNAIASFLTDEAERVKKGAASRRIAEQHSHIEMVSQYERLFQSVAVQHAPGAVYGAASL